MAKIPFSKLKMKVTKQPVEVPIPDTGLKLTVITYLPQDQKADFITFVIQHSIDMNTGCFSPIRLDTFFSIALAKWYGQITFTDKQLQDAPKTYDVLQSNGIFNIIAATVPDDEYKFIEELVKETAEDVARFNSSAAGLITAINSQATDLNTQMTEIMEKVKNKEGLEELAAIRNIVGKKD